MRIFVQALVERAVESKHFEFMSVGAVHNPGTKSRAYSVVPAANAFQTNFFASLVSTLTDGGICTDL